MGCAEGIPCKADAIGRSFVKAYWYNKTTGTHGECEIRGITSLHYPVHPIPKGSQVYLPPLTSLSNGLWLFLSWQGVPINWGIEQCKELRAVLLLQGIPYV